MPGTGDSGQQLGVATCGCASEMRRVCDLCDGPSRRFVACSLTCLNRHLAVRGAIDMKIAGDEGGTFVGTRISTGIVVYLGRR